MKEHVEALIQEMIPQIRNELREELKPQYEAQYNEQLQHAMKEITQTDFRRQQVEELNKEVSIIQHELTKQILSQLESEFEQEKTSIIHNVSQGLNKSRAVQQLEDKLRNKIMKENSGYFQEEVKKKINLFRLNQQKQYEEEKRQITIQLTDEFTSKLQLQLDQLEQSKSQLYDEYQKEKDKLGKIETDQKTFNQLKTQQENQYGAEIEQLHQQVETLTQKINQVKLMKSSTKQQKYKIEYSQEKPIVSSIKVEKEPLQLFKYNGIDLIQYDQLPDLFFIEQQNQAQPLNTSNKIQSNEKKQPMAKSDIKGNESQQIMSFNVSQPSIVKQYTKQSNIANKESKISLNTTQNQSEIITRLEELCKQKLQNSQINKINTSSENKSRLIEKNLPLDKFEQLFQIDAKDSNHVKHLKQLRQQLQQQFINDLEQEEYYLQKITYLKYNFTKSFPKEQQRLIYENLNKLLEIWNKGHISYCERLDLIEQILNSQQALQKIQLVTDECVKHYDQYSRLIDKLLQRQSFRSQIQKENFSVQRNRKLFVTLKQLSEEISNLLVPKFYWREVDVSYILQVDQLEQQIIAREELRDEISKKIERKFNN